MNENETTTRTFLPGPWREYDRNDIGDIYLCGEGGSAVAIVLESTIPTVAGRTEANARLIAAAPAMLEALQAVIDDYIFAAGGRLMDDVYAQEHPVMRARDAVAKALGGAS